MMHVGVFLGFLIFGSTGGEIAITRGMKATGSQNDCGRENCFASWARRCAVAGSGLEFR